MRAGRFHTTQSRQKWPPANCSFVEPSSRPKARESSHYPQDVSPPHSPAVAARSATGPCEQQRLNRAPQSAAEGNSSARVLLPAPKLSRAIILTVPWSVNGKSLLSTSGLVSAAHTHRTQQKFQSIRQVGPSRWKGRKETHKQ